MTKRWWEKICKSYCEEGRFYHTLEHLQELFTHVDRITSELSDQISLELAIWFHDIVYDARKGTGGKNEEDSALVFCQFADDVGAVCAARVAKISRWIVLTKHHRCSVDDELDAKYFVDMDMAIIGQSQPRYSAYASEVRAEYSHVPWPMFCYYRARFLRATASQDRIFNTQHFRGLESTARANASREARLLELSMLASLAVAVDSIVVLVAVMLNIPTAFSVGASVLILRLLFWLAAERTLVPYPYASLPRALTAVFAASFNPPHAGHVALLRRLATTHARVYAVVSHNPSKTYAVSAEERATLLEAAVANEAWLRERVECVVVGGYVWRYALERRADFLFRGIRSWRDDGLAEKLLEALNIAGPLLLGPCRMPVPTRYLQADPRSAHISSSTVRRRIANSEPICDLVPACIHERVLAAYRH